MHEITTPELLQLFEKEGTVIIDVRSPDAYNGWQLHNEPRGGHIPGARSLPEKWIRYMDWIEMVMHKQILPRHFIVVYGYNELDSGNVARHFIKSGYPHVVVYGRFIKEWSGNPDLPLQKPERYRHLVPASWVNMLISGKQPPCYDNDKFVVVHTHYRNRDAYLSGHIPRAIDMDTLAIEAPETWNRRSPLELKKAFEEHGIASDSTVVLYGKYMSPDNNDPFPGSAAGDIGAMRCAFVMMYAGVKDVRVLNGGFQAWVDEGYDTSCADEPRRQIADFGADIPVNPGYAVDLPEARQILASQDAELVCVRSWPEFIGEVSGYNYINKKGRIPGAIFADCGSDAYHMENYRNFDQTCREYHEIARNWIRSGITPDKKLAFYCGTGWRGAEAWFNAWLMAWPTISVYDGGWFEWSSDPENPVESGIPVSEGNKTRHIPISDTSGHMNELEIISELLTGLSAPQKSVPCRFFYDDAGSDLFEEITTLPEYYLTRTEKILLKIAGTEIFKNSSFRNIVELGSGDCSKSSILISSMPKKHWKSTTYIPIDINLPVLEKSARILTEKFHRLKIHPFPADFMKDFRLIPCHGNKLVCFLGSTIGNMDKEEAIHFLRSLKSWMYPDDRLLIGFDLVKDTSLLEKAYNDSEGVTARFNKNVLKVLNRYLDTRFCPDQFEHVSFYNPEKARIEMHLRAVTDMEITSPFLNGKICIRNGETIHTENSCKYQMDDIDFIAKESGLEIVTIFSDPNQWFSLVLFR